MPKQRHTIVALVDNEPGVLARVIGLFSGRGYNIESLTVAQVDKVRGLSRINIVTTGTEFVIEQIKSLLAKLVPVQRVQDLTAEGPHVERELALVKVTGDRERLIAGAPARRLHARAAGRQHAGLASCSRSPARRTSSTPSSTCSSRSRSAAPAWSRSAAARPSSRRTRRAADTDDNIAREAEHHARLLRCRRRPQPDQEQEGRRRRLRQPGLRPCQQPQGQRRARGRGGAEARLGHAPEGRGRRHQVP